MNSNTYGEIRGSELEMYLLRNNGSIAIDESIPDGVIRRTEEFDVPELKRRAERAHYGQAKTRSGYTKPGQQPRNKAKAKASRAARKRNR